MLCFLQTQIYEKKRYFYKHLTKKTLIIGGEANPSPATPTGRTPGELIILPNAFTPDGDGLNDVFKAIGQPDNLSSFSMTIFNRWGQMVFESSDISLGWDGTYQGKPAPAGTYVFRVEYSISSRSFDTSGTVVLIR